MAVQLTSFNSFAANTLSSRAARKRTFYHGFVNVTLSTLNKENYSFYCLQFSSKKEALPNAEEISTAREIVMGRKVTRSAPVQTGKRKQEVINLGHINGDIEEPAKKKGAVDTVSRMTNESNLRELMMN